MKKPFHAEVHFTIGQTVYLRLEADEEPGMVTAITFSGEKCEATYTVAWGTYSGTHFAMELTGTYEPKYPENDA